MRTLFSFFLLFFRIVGSLWKGVRNVFVASMAKNSVVLARRLLSVTFTRGRAIRNGFATRVSQTYNRGKPSTLRGSVKCSTNTRRVCRHLTVKFDYSFLPSTPLLPPLSVVERCVWIDVNLRRIPPSLVIRQLMKSLGVYRGFPGVIFLVCVHGAKRSAKRSRDERTIERKTSPLFQTSLSYQSSG